MTAAVLSALAVHAHVRLATPVVQPPPVRRPMPPSLSYVLDATLDDHLGKAWLALEFPATAQLVEEISWTVAPLAAATVLCMRTPISSLMQTSILIGLLCGSVPMADGKDVGSRIAQMAARCVTACRNCATRLLSRRSMAMRASSTNEAVAPAVRRPAVRRPPLRGPGVEPLELPQGLSLWSVQDHPALSRPRQVA